VIYTHLFVSRHTHDRTCNLNEQILLGMIKIEFLNLSFPQFDSLFLFYPLCFPLMYVSLCMCVCMNVCVSAYCAMDEIESDEDNDYSTGTHSQGQGSAKREVRSAGDKSSSLSRPLGSSLNKVRHTYI
jgi:hypothetical protein